jgi:hypothetical protein
MLPYVAQIEGGLSPPLICATYGSIQSVRKQILHIYNVLLRMSAVTLETCRGT